jgi:hypothetical protein
MTTVVAVTVTTLIASAASAATQPYAPPRGRPAVPPLAVPTPAKPTLADPTLPDPTLPDPSLAVPRSTQVDAEHYWTRERRARAVQGDMVTRREARRVAPERRPTNAGGPSTLAGRRANPLAAAPTSIGAVYTQGGQVSRSVGKLFVTFDGIDYMCSASIVSSRSLDLAVTAGHCLHDGGPSGHFATNVAFAPGYVNQSAPYGLWTARKITTTTRWSAARDFEADVGFIAVNTLNNLHLQQVAGSLGIVFNAPRSDYQWAFGYPARPPYDGGRLSYCAGLPLIDPYGGTALGLRCSMTAGASGGPWTVGFSRYADGGGYVDSVVSYNYLGDSTRLYGPYFGSAVKALYTASTAM